MELNKYTPEQQKAIITTGSNIIVSAGAGSGKTQVLTERVTYLINQGYKLDEFLILTFTNLAAGEMKDRIRKSLKAINSPEYNNVDRANIMTFDAYSLSLVKKYHFKLNLTNDIKITEKVVLDVKKRQIIRELFEKSYKDNIEFKKFVANYENKNDDELQDLLLEFYDKANSEIDSENYVNTFLDKYYSTNKMDEMIEELKKDIIDRRDTFIDGFIYLPETPIKISDKTFKYYVIDKFNDFLKAKTYDEFVNSLKNPDVMNWPNYPQNYDPNNKKNYDSLKTKAKELCKFINNLPKSKEDFYEFILENKKYAKVIIDLYKELDIKIKEYKQEHQAYEFMDIAKMALKLVLDENIAKEIKDNLKIIMIDEYQDTSELQDVFISKIANNNVYMVGDVKQSIYRFRNARSDLFLKKYNDYKNGIDGIAIDMNKNFRSRREVLDDINFIFEKIMKPNTSGIDYEKDHTILFGNKDYIEKGKTNQNYKIEYLTLPEASTDEASQAEASIIARDIIEKMNNNYQVYDKEIKALRNAKLSDFCILMDRGGAFEDYAKVFNDFKIPLYVENDDDITRNVIVLVLTNLLKVIKGIIHNDYESPEFKLALSSIARSFIYQETDDFILDVSKNKLYDNNYITNEIRNIVTKCSDMSISDVIYNIILNLDIYIKCIRIGNVEKNNLILDKYLGLYKSMSDLDYSIDDFIEFMTEIDKSNLQITFQCIGTSLDSVKLMNIHKSKGLEFPIVYYSGLNKQFNRLALDNKFNVSEKFGLVLPPNENEEHILKLINKNYEKKLDSEEKLRLFYVALTRAKEKIIFVYQNEQAKDILNMQIIPSLIEYLEPLNDFIINSNKSDILKRFYDDYISGVINESLFRRVAEENLMYIPNKINIKETDFDELLAIAMYPEKLHKDLKEMSDNLEDLICNAFEMFKRNEIEFDLFKMTLKYFDADIIDDGIKKVKKNEYNELAKYLNITCSENDIKNSSYLFEEKFKYKELFDRALYNYYYYDFSFDDFCFVSNYLGISFNEEEIICLENKKDSPEEFSCLCEISKFTTKSNNEIDDLIEEMNNDLAKGLLTYNDIAKITDFLKIYIHNCVEKLYDMIDSEISKNDFVKYINLLGYRYIDNDLGLCDKLIITEELFKIYYSYFKKDSNIPVSAYIFIDAYLNETISFEELQLCLNSCGYKISNMAILQNEISLENTDVILYEETVLNDKDINLAKNFRSYISPFFEKTRFNHYSYFMCDEYSPIKIDEKNKDTIELKEVVVVQNKILEFRASKELNLSSNKSLMDFGTQMHLIMEQTNLKNPDFKGLTIKQKQIIETFLKAPFMANIASADIFSEYEFSSDVNGIIDLMLVYDDHIDIIDYKTKNIDDASYDKQLKIYKNYAENTFNKSVNCYLYSLLDGVYRKLN